MASSDQFKFQDRTGEKNLVLRRTLVAFFLVVMMTGALLWRLFFLQVVEHDVYETKSRDNRVQVQPIPPTRGLIYDRNGHLLAENLPAHQLSLVMERVDNLEQTLADLRELVEITDRQEKRFRQRLKRYRRPYEPVPIKFNLNEGEIARLAVNTYFLDGVEVEANLIRRYPYGDSFAHVLGYVGRISEKELRKLDPGTYAGTGHIGKLGIEKTYEDDLLGQVGYRTVETNARGRILTVLEREAPKPGADLHLYLDLELQQLAEKEMAGKRGAVVALDPKTGGILAMVSAPAYNPNLFVTGISNEAYSSLRDSLDVPFLNRASRGLYAPASTIKPFLGMGAIKYGVVDWQTQVYNPGFWELPTEKTTGRTRWRDWTWNKNKAPENVNLAKAIIQSVDTYFYEVAFNMKLEAMNDTLTSFGFGRVTSLDVHNPKSGINPTRDWKKAHHGYSWFAGDSVNMGIGQGFLLASPMQVAIATMVLVNDGDWKIPRLLMKAANGEVQDRKVKLPEPLKVDDPQDWQRMKKAMRDVLHSARGTARLTGQGAPFEIAGKTGTAQVFTVKEDEEYESEEVKERLRDHAWFTGYAPYDDPQIVVTVFVENGEHGSWVAPIARKMFENWVARQDKIKALEEEQNKAETEVKATNSQVDPVLPNQQPPTATLPADTANANQGAG